VVQTATTVRNKVL